MGCNCRPRGASCGSTCKTKFVKSTPVVKEINRVSGISTAVVDDANEVTYFYGNIQHENYHNPAAECLPFIVVPTNWQTYRTFRKKTEVFEGEFVDNTIILDKTPTAMRHIFVFLNGVHQDEGQELDYVLDGKTLSFNTHTLIETDRVTVKYDYIKAGK